MVKKEDVDLGPNTKSKNSWQTLQMSDKHLLVIARLVKIITPDIWV